MVNGNSKAYIYIVQLKEISSFNYLGATNSKDDS